jgi:Glycosyl hydrolase-like 10
MANSKDNIQPNAPILPAYWVPYTNTLDKPAEAPPNKPDTDNVQETMRQAFLRHDVKELYVDAVAAAGPTFEGSGLGKPVVQKPPDSSILVNRQGIARQEPIPLDMIKRFEQWKAHSERSDVKIVGWYESWNYAKPGTDLTRAIGVNDETVLNPVTKRGDRGKPESFLTNNDGVIHFDPFNEQVFEKQKSALIALAKKPEVNAIALDDHLGLLSTTKKVYTDPQQIQNIRSQIDSGKLSNVSAKLNMREGKLSLEVTIDLRAEVLKRHPEISSDQGISDRITEHLRTIHNEMKDQGINKPLIISTNPLDFAKKDTHQDIRRWVQEGLVDKLNVQIYRKDFGSFKSEVDKLKSQLEGLQTKLPEVSISLAKSAGGGVPDEVLRQEAEYVKNTKIGGKAVELIGFDYEAFPKQTASSQQAQSDTSDIARIAYQYLERPNKILGFFPNPFSGPRGNKEEFKLNNQTYTIERNQNVLTVRAKSDMVNHESKPRLVVKAEIQNVNGQLNITPIVNKATEQDRTNFRQLQEKEQLKTPSSTLKANASPSPGQTVQPGHVSSAQAQTVLDAAKTVVEKYGSGRDERVANLGRYEISRYQPDGLTDRIIITDRQGRGEIFRYDKGGSSKVALTPEDVNNFQKMQKFVEHKQNVTAVASTAQKMAWNYGQMIDPQGPRISNHSYEDRHYRIVDNEQGLRIHAADGREVLNYPRTDRVLVSERLATDSLAPHDIEHFQGMNQRMEQQTQQERSAQRTNRDLVQAQSGNSQLAL